VLSAEAVLPLLLRFELRDPPSVRSNDAEHTLSAAAVAFHAGEPRRALGILRADPPAPGDSAAVATALRIVSEVYDRNWFPGDGAAVFEPGDAEQLTDMAEPEASTPTGRLLVMVATQLVAAVPTWRRLTVDGPRIALVGLRQCAGSGGAHRRRFSATRPTPLVVPSVDFRAPPSRRRRSRTCTAAARSPTPPTTAPC
jgi:hypothetical protein